MKTIRLTQGKTALVDDSMFDFINQWKWFAHKASTNVFHARRTSWNKTTKKHEVILMHRLIMGATSPDIFIDHKDQNGLNNQVSNLRICSHQQNCKNRRSVRGSSSKFLGVHFSKAANKWKAEICVNGKNKYLGLFTNEYDAAIAYNRAATEHHGEYANLNIVHSEMPWCRPVRN